MKEYIVVIGGIEHTLQLSDADAKARGLNPVEPVATKQAPTPSNKARTAQNKSGGS